jgi:4-amino-4-deoxy-L-arabinose transferase-like glycosyltransferase
MMSTALGGVDLLPEASLARGRRRLLARLVLGREDDAVWVRPALLGLLICTAALYLWDLSASGWANSFYSAAVQAGAKSWKAFFFGSFDASSFITVDKPPVSLWVMELSARLFGVNSWSILVPQALEGVAAVGLLYATVRRSFRPSAALLAGAAMALTPVAALMFRFNNPDALLTLLLVGAVYATVRSLERGKTTWLVAAAILVGGAFLTKSLQAFVILPVLAGVYFLAAPVSWRRRLFQLALATVALVVSSGWWVAVVELIPAAHRPYIGGSQDNSVLNLIFGYNGLGRITGNETGSVGGFGNAGGRWGATGWSRLFSSDMGGQISWLIPAALILLVACLWLTRRAPRTDRTRAAFLIWGGWLLITGAVFSFAAGIIHAYYTVALAPAVAALVGMGALTLWEHRARWLYRSALAAAVVAAAAWSFVLLGRSPSWYPWLRWTELLMGLLAAAGIVALPRVRGRVALVLCAAAAVASLMGSAAFTLYTVATPHSGSIPTAGPATSGGSGFGGGRGFGGGGPGGGAQGDGGAAGQAPGGFGTGNGTAQGGGTPPAQGGAVPGGVSQTGDGGARQAGGGNAGSLLNGSTPGSKLTALLKANSHKYTWVAAAVGANSAAGYQLASDDPVMAIGGFNGTDPWPTLAEFERLVKAGRIHYFIGGGSGGGSGSGSSSQISSWVQKNYTVQTIDGVTIYDLSAAG